MGLSSSKSTSTTKPVYSAQIEGAANNVNAAYGAQSPKISAITDALGGLAPNLVGRFTNGDSGVNAAKSYDTDVLSGKYLHGSPELDAIVSQTNDSTRNGLAASLGTRGLTGGSAFGDIITRALAQNETGLRYQDYGAERSRMDAASGRAPGLAAAGYLPIQSLLEIAQAQQLPVQAAAGAGSSIGGLLGQYGTTTQKTSPSLGAIIAQLAGNAAQAYAMGG
ncbi:MAG: hypothetical protein ACOYBT_09925 [Polynucleobacter sp.]